MEGKDMLKIVMLPWLAHGHVSPFLELAKRLAKRNHAMYVCSTKVILDSIKKSTVIENEYPLVYFVEIQFPHPPELPPHYHTTKGLPPHLNFTLLRAFSMGSPAFSTILDQIKPDLVVYDLHTHWAPAVAASLSIPAVIFHTSSVSALCHSFHVMSKQEGEFPYPEIIPQGSYWMKRLDEMESENNKCDHEKVSVVDSYLRSSEIVLEKTFKEVEEGYVDYTSSILGKRLILTGPLVTNPTEHDIVTENVKPIMEWLDKKDKGSTVFVSFGSECYLSREERDEMAYGLEQSTVNFIWVIRFPAEEKESILEYSANNIIIPQGFLERVGERGLVVIEQWVPQAGILTHQSVGGFITHCGWGSITEAIGFGVPIIAMPMQYDQPTNARVVVNAGVGAEVERDVTNGFNPREISRVIRKIILEDEGKDIRMKAQEIKQKFLKEGDHEEIDGVIKEFLRISRNFD